MFRDFICSHKISVLHPNLFYITFHYDNFYYPGRVVRNRWKKSYLGHVKNSILECHFQQNTSICSNRKLLGPLKPIFLWNDYSCDVNVFKRLELSQRWFKVDYIKPKYKVNECPNNIKIDFMLYIENGKSLSPRFYSHWGYFTMNIVKSYRI